MYQEDDQPIDIDPYLWPFVDAVCENMPYEDLLESMPVKCIQECMKKYPDRPFSVSCYCFAPWEVTAAICQETSEVTVFYDIESDSIIFESFDDMFNGLLHIADMILKKQEYSVMLSPTTMNKMRKYCRFMQNVTNVLDVNEVSEMMDAISMK